MCGKAKQHLIAFSVFLLCSATIALALPWDTDMNKQDSFKPNELNRAPVKDTVPIGSRHIVQSAEEAEATLKNPSTFSLNSVWRGKRLWNANCLTCHGKSGMGDGPVGPQMAVPSLLSEFYKGRADGRVFYVIHYGGAAMPRYGYKLSLNESWDLVNYLRYLQGRPVMGMDKP